MGSRHTLSANGRRMGHTGLVTAYPSASGGGETSALTGDILDRHAGSARGRRREVELEHVIALTRGRASWKSRASRVAILDHAAGCHRRIESMVCLPAVTQVVLLTVSDG